MPPERTYIPLNQAAVFLAERIWQPHNSSLALRRLKGDGWKINDLSDALHFMRVSEMPKAQEKIDALLAVSRLPLYEWPSRIRTNDRNGAFVNEAELLALLLAGVHLDTPNIQTTIPSPALVVPAGASDGNEQTQAPERRLALLRALDGCAKYAHGEWKFTGMAALVAKEKADGRKRCDAKTIRADLKEAAKTERDAKNAGFATGLGKL